MRNIFINEVCKAAENNPNLWLVTADLGYSILEPFSNNFPDRFVNVGVAEQNMIGIAAGLALSGCQVVTYSIVNFSTFRCLEQIRNDVCYHNANVKIVGVGGGYAYGSQGYTHHGIEDLTVMMSLPNIDVLAPADPTEAKLAARSVLDESGPAYVRLGKSGEPDIHNSEIIFSRGKIIEVRRGEKILIIATGTLLSEAMKASDLLEAKGHNISVWSSPWLAPFDKESINMAARSYDLIITAEENSNSGGLGSAVAKVIASSRNPRAKQIISAIPNTLEPVSGSEIWSRSRKLLDSEGITNAILANLKSHSPN